MEGTNELGIEPTSDQIAGFAVHARELMKWNKRINLTAISDPFDIAVNHFIDSLAPIPYISDFANLLDIGSGGGFPGIPIKIATPSLEVTLIDGSRKKTSFQRHVIRTLNLTGIEAHHIRAEQFVQERRKFDVVVCRALTSLERFVQWGAPFLSDCGILLALKGRNAESEAESLPDGFKHKIIHYRAPITKSRRSIVMISRRREKKPDESQICKRE